MFWTYIPKWLVADADPWTITLTSPGLNEVAVSSSSDIPKLWTKPIFVFRLATELVLKPDFSPKCGCTSKTSSKDKALVHGYGFATMDNTGKWDKDG